VRLPEAIPSLGRFLLLARLFEKAGYDAINCDGALQLDYYKKIKDAVGIPAIIAGRMNDPELSSRLVKEGYADGISMGRPLPADPYYVNKLKSNRPEEIRHCLACNQGCIGRILSGSMVSCAINATAGTLRSIQLEPVERPRKVMVVVGGIAGMEAARVAALRGHEVSLYEKTDRLGGVFIAAASFEFKEDNKKLIDWYRLQMQECDVDVHLNTVVTPALVEQLKP